MDGKTGTNSYPITSFTCKVLVKEDDAFFVEPSRQMFDFFGTNEDSYANGFLTRIRTDIGDISADALSNVLFDKAAKGEDFRLLYPSMRADGSPCQMQLDAYYDGTTEEGSFFNVIEMDITELVEAKERAEKLAAENQALTEDAPVGQGIYHIKDNKFDLVYTNSEYYHVHHGSKEYWDSFKGRDAMERIVAEDRALLYEEWKTVLKNPDHIYDAAYRCVGEDGEIHWVRLIARLSNIIIDGMYICYATYLDIDREKKNEELATSADKTLIDTINNLPSNSLLCRVMNNNRITIETYSDDFCNMVGCSQDNIREVYTEDAFYAVHPDDLDKILESLNKHVNDMTPTNIAYRIITRSGAYKWVNVSYIFFDVSDKRYLYAVFTDIDEMKKHEEQLNNQYETSQSYLESISDTYIATMRVNVTKGDIEYVSGSDSIHEIHDLSMYSDIYGVLMPQLPREEDRAEFIKRFSKTALLHSYSVGETRLSIDFLVKSKNGPALWERATVNLTQRPGSNDVIAFFAVSDIHEDKTIDTILNNILIKQYDFISSIDVDSNTITLVSINAQSASINEIHNSMDYDGLMHEYCDNHVIPEEKDACIKFMTLKNVVNALEKDDICSATFTVEEDGMLLNKKIDYGYIDRDSKLITLIRTDITDIHKQQMYQEEELRSALLSAQQASIAKSDFLSRMSHEIRTPMNAIIGLDTIALQEQGLSSAMEDHLKKIGISARFLLSLINDILDMSRIESGKMLLKNKEFDFKKLIDNISSILYSQCEENGIDYECVIKGYIEEKYVGDEVKIQQVLLNILGNSVKFTPIGGKIHFMIEQLSHDTENAKLRFTIADTGKGIDSEYLPHIFDTFSQEEGGSTTAYGGTGLGLAISKSLVELMNGSIQVHSIKAMGTDFTVEITLGLPESRKKWNKLLPTKSLKALDTLVVDDDIIVCQHTKIVLNEAGINAEWVESGTEAIAGVEKRHSEGRDYNLILIDWKMPDMDGIETAREIRKIVGPDVTILILTAYDWTTIEKKARDAGVDNFMRKPVFASSVIQAYNEVQSNHERISSKGKNYYDFEGHKVLLVEDNLINLEIAQTLLEMVGFTVDTAENGIDAIKAFTESKPGEYAAILMDIRMPMMDGLETTKTIRNIKKADSETIPIIAMSANAFDEDIKKSLDAGMNEHLSKPIEAEHLYEVLNHLINK